jgi:hypothetical protein
MTRIPRCLCVLPKTIESLCETGCIYREPAVRHLACPRATKTDVCCAPCPPLDCTCRPDSAGGRQPKLHTYYHEVYLLRETSNSKLHVQMR